MLSDEPNRDDTIRIFFKDKISELKGPYTERQVQEWYREKWFDSSFPFYFMKEGEQPNELTEFLTLETLCARNGIGCPFKMTTVNEARETMEDKLIRLEKNLADLSKKCDVVKKMEKRLEEMEKKLTELSTEPPKKNNDSASAAAPAAAKPAATAAAAQRAQSGRAPASHSDEGHTSGFANLFMDVCKSFQRGAAGGEAYKLAQSLTNSMPGIEHGLECLTDDQREILLNKVVRKFDSIEYLFCSFCERFMFNAHQTFMHIGCPNHISQMSAISPMFLRVSMALINMVGGVMAVKGLIFEAEEHIRNQHHKYCSMSLDDPELLPSDAVAAFQPFDMAVSEALEEAGSGANLGHSVMGHTADTIMQLAKGECGEELMNALDAHIGNAKTRCRTCRLIFANADEFYEHLQTFHHIRNADPFDANTMLANMRKRKNVSLHGWPFS